VLVTGGAGFIGSHCCVDLLEAGYDVVVVSPTPPALARAPISSRVHIDWRRVGARLKGMRVRV
jgi:nucleoside-diphosphate-sugar epimerase